MTSAVIYLVRHGETQENIAGIIQGQLDTNLNPTGVEQAKIVASALRHVPFGIAYTSDLERAAKTAEAILRHHAPVSLIRQQALREIFMGELQGKPIRKGGFHKDPPSMESRTAFAARTLKWWNENITTTLASKAHDKEPVHILVVSHGYYITTLVRSLLYAGLIEGRECFRLGNCFNTSVTTIEMQDDKKGRLVKWADMSHLVAPVVQTNADELQEFEQNGVSKN